MKEDWIVVGTTLPNGVAVSQDEEWLWQVYNYKCIKHWWKWAVCIHHDPPRSLNSKWAEMPETWFPVCQECHEEFHQMGSNERAALIQKLLINWPTAERKIHDYKESENWKAYLEKEKSQD